MLKNTSQVWRGVKAKDLITLSDAATIANRMKDGKAPTPETYEVKSVLRIRLKDNLVEWRMAQINDAKGEWLVAKIADETVSLYVFSEGDWLPATRSELLDEGANFLFQEPKSAEFDPEDLRYATEIAYEKDSSAKDKDVLYSIKPQGELTGEAFWQPARSGLSDLIGTVVEYSGADADCPELMLLEIGTKGNGSVQMLRGYPLNDGDVTVLSR